MAGADERAVGRSVGGVVLASPLTAELPSPARLAGAAAVHGVAGAAVLTLAGELAVGAVTAVGALLLALEIEMRKMI